MFAPQTQSDNFVVMKRSLCSHKVKCTSCFFMRFDCTSLAKRLHFSCTEGVLKSTTLSVRNIVALQGGAPKYSHFGERTRCVMNEFSPKAETSDMEPPRTRSASQCSLFLPAQSTASSAAGSAVLRTLTRSAPNIQSVLSK